ncbi:MAG TPA: HDOD domain-containing protein, partial [Spirochaetia bacterium]|nr:HDOD domain-containing protein [Spirochaetia bacterium]
MADTSEKLTRVRGYIDRMPSLPPTVTKVLEICNDPKTSPVDLNRIISLDPVLMARVLRLINSAYYGIPTKIVSMVRAIIMLGINTVKNLALSTAVMDTLHRKSDLGVLDPVEFWRHSLAVGVTSKLLAKLAGVDASNLDEYFTAGLLHDIGKIPLDRVFADEYARVIAVCAERKSPLATVERELLGFDHTDTGRIIVEAWRLGSVIRDTVSHHHDPAGYGGPDRNIVYTVHAASHYVNQKSIGDAGDRFPAGLDPIVAKTLQIDNQIMDGITATVDAEIQKAEIFL